MRAATRTDAAPRAGRPPLWPALALLLVTATAAGVVVASDPARDGDGGRRNRRAHDHVTTGQGHITGIIRCCIAIRTR